MKFLRVINYVGLVFAVIVIFGLPVHYTLMDMFLTFAVCAVVYVLGLITIIKSGPVAKFFYMASSVLLVFAVINLDYYYPGLNIIERNYEMYGVVRNEITGGVLIIVALVLMLNVIFASILHNDT